MCRNVLLLMIGALVGCGGAGPTNPSPDPPPEVVVKGRPDLEAETLDRWTYVKACAGVSRVTSAFPITVVPDHFLCGEVDALGCFHYTRITAAEFYEGRRVYGPVVQHEFIHLAMHLNGQGADHAHTSPLWAKCSATGAAPPLGAFDAGPERVEVK